MKVNHYLFCTALFAVIVLALFGGTIVHADTIYAYCDVSNSIEKFNSSGQKSTFASGVHSQYLTCDRYGNLYSTPGYEINKYDSSGNRTIFASGSNLDNVSGLAFDNSSNLYAADGGNGNILKFDSSGHKTTFIPTTPYFSPSVLAFDGSSHFYTIDGLDIKKIDMSGNISIFASGFDDPMPFGLACDSSSNLYASLISDTSTIVKFDSSGNYTTFASGLNGPMSLAFDSGGNLYVADAGSTGIGDGRILKFDSNGNMSVFASGLDGPTAIAIYVPEPASMTILALGGLALLGRRRK